MFAESGPCCSGIDAYSHPNFSGRQGNPAGQSTYWSCLVEKGPLIREGLTILKSSGPGLEIQDVRRHQEVLWSRIYDLVVYPAPRLTIQEWILPRLQGILEKVHLP